MPDQSSKKPKRPRDLNVLAKKIVEIATEGEPTEEPSEKNPHAVALGKLGGKKGGKARADKLTPEQRKEIAQLAARARWKKSEND
ncbi:MAG: hypothetical protein WC593_15760 [Methanoregula sp.]